MMLNHGLFMFILLRVRVINQLPIDPIDESIPRQTMLDNDW